jgi:hypothetical protein
MIRYVQSVRCPGTKDNQLHANIYKQFPKSDSCPYGCGPWPSSISIDSSPPSSPSYDPFNSSDQSSQSSSSRTDLLSSSRSNSIPAQSILAPARNPHLTGSIPFMQKVTQPISYDRTSNLLRKTIVDNVNKATDLRGKTAVRHAKQPLRDQDLGGVKCQVTFWLLPQMLFEKSPIYRRGAGRAIRTRSYSFLLFLTFEFLTCSQGILSSRHSTGERWQIFTK